MNKYSMPAALKQTGDAGGPSFTTGNALGPQAGRPFAGNVCGTIQTDAHAAD